MDEARKIEVLSLLQEVLNQRGPILPRDIGISEEEAGHLASEGLIELGEIPSSPAGGQIVIAEMTPRGLSMTISHERKHPRPFLVAVQPESLFSRILASLANKLWEIAIGIFLLIAGILLTAWLNAS